MTVCVGMSELKGDGVVWEEWKVWEVGWSGGMAGSGSTGHARARETGRERTGAGESARGAGRVRTVGSDAHRARERAGEAGSGSAPRALSAGGVMCACQEGGAQTHMIMNAGECRAHVSGSGQG